MEDHRYREEHQASRAKTTAQNAHEEQVQFVRDQKRAKLKSDCQLMVQKAEKRTLHLELFKSGKTWEEMASLMALIDSINP